MPTIVVAPMSTVSRTIDATLWPRAMNVATVAHARPARTKNCQAWRPSSLLSSVEVSELIVEARAHGGVFGLCLGGVFVLSSVPRPADRNEAHARHAGCAEEV